MKREDVYKLIDGEREYQESLPPARTDGKEHSVGEYLVMLKVYTDKALEAWTSGAGDTAALDVVRKCAGIAIHCIEDHGAPERKV
jgi:hypothetical protein